MPKISIVVPIYKAEAFLSKCLDSILVQNYSDWECLLIDDGSPDNSGTICDEYAKKDPRFKVFHKNNAGVSAARNYGLEKSCGEWTIFVDSDDWLDKTCFQDCIAIIDKYNVDILQFGYKKVKFSGEVISEHVYRSSYSQASRYAQTRHKNLCAAGSFIKSDLIRNYNIRFREGVKYAEDQMFIMNCMKYSNNIMYHSEIYYNYHINCQSAVHNAKFEDKVKSCYEIEAFAGDDKIYGIWKDNLLFNFFIDFILNYNINDDYLKSLLKEFNVRVNNLYGLKRKLIYLAMLFNSIFAVKIIKKLLG